MPACPGQAGVFVGWNDKYRRISHSTSDMSWVGICGGQPESLLGSWGQCSQIFVGHEIRTVCVQIVQNLESAC